jgi:hypothetical protein
MILAWADPSPCTARIARFHKLHRRQFSGLSDGEGASGNEGFVILTMALSRRYPR